MHPAAPARPAFRHLTLSTIATLFFVAVRSIAATAQTEVDWSTYLGNKQRNLYSPLDQINRSNVAQLEVAWTYDTGEKGEYQCNNLIVAGVLYTATSSRK